MQLDLHVHSVFSGDSPVKPEDYARRALELRGQGHELDGFALTEHNFLITPEKFDLASLARDTGLVILAGVEIDTYWGHLLVYGLDARLWAEIQGDKVRKHEPLRLCKFLSEQGGVALVPSHPFRHLFGIRERCLELPGITALEGLNGANEPHENRQAQAFAARKNIPMTGGSDAHFLPELGKAVTVFNRPVAAMADLVRELKAGIFQAAALVDPNGPVRT